MIKIIEISNCHLWDGLEVDNETFTKIMCSLNQSKWQHTVTYKVGVEYFTECLGSK